MTTRNLTQAMQDASRAGRVIALYAFELVFDTFTTRLHTGVGDITISGNVYQGLGNFAAVSSMREGSTLEANGLVLQLSRTAGGVAVLIGTAYYGRPANVYIGCLDENYQLIADPVGPWRYRMDASEVLFSESSELKLQLETRAAQWARANTARYTSEDHKRTYPDDLFFDFVARTQDQEIIWPHAAGSSSSGKKTDFTPVFSE